jgi:outer membrane receptor protein involved in Fe transport
MTQSKRRSQTLGAVVAGILTPLAAPVANAQETSAEGVLDEIVVSARRREESLQTVPLAITAFSGESLEARGIDMVGSMNAMAPNLSVQGGQGREIESSAAFRVRGVPGVAVYVDGIDQTNAIGLFTMGVVEVDRIEVLRGPQGTLFGNSALGGAVQYVTRRPAEEFGGRVQARAGTFNRRDLQASIDLPITDNVLTKFTMADMNAEGFMTSIDSGNKYGDINDQFYRADVLFTPGDAVTLRYAYDKSTQDRMGGARAVWEIGPKSIFTLPNGVVFNTNPHAQAYENAFGILFDDRNVVSGFPGGVVGEYETRVAHDTHGLFLDLDRQTFDVTWDINDDFQFHAILGRREQERRLMVDFDSDSRVFFADRQDNDDITEDSGELQLLGSHGNRDQFNWVLGYYVSDRLVKSRFPTYSATPFVCDLITRADVRGVTIADRANCFNNRMRALNLQNTYVATPQMTAAQISGAPGSLWNQVLALGAAANYRGVTPASLAAQVGPNFDSLDITAQETTALFADLSWDVTEKLSLNFGIRKQEDDHPGTDQVRDTAAVANIVEPSPWDNYEYNLRDPFGYWAINARVGISKYEKTTARVSAQYQFKEDLMAYITLSNGYGPGGATTVPTNILTLNAAGVATGGLLRDVYNNNPTQLDLPYQLVRGEQTVDNFEVGLKADWLDGRMRTNLAAFVTDWRNMTGSTYVATVWWDLVGGDGIAESRVPCAARCDRTNTYEVNYFPNLLTSAVLKAEASGIEVELTWVGNENYQIGFNTGLLDTSFKELGQAGEGTVPAYNTGDKFAGAPDMTANLWGQYDWSLSEGRSLSARLDYTWTDDYTTFAGGPLQRTQEAFGLLNARFVLDTGNNWQFLIAGTNLTDEYYSPAFFYTVSQQVWDGSVGRPREVYFGLNFSFN